MNVHWAIEKMLVCSRVWVNSNCGPILKRDLGEWIKEWMDG